MNLSLNDVEIKKAIELYISNQGIDIDDKTVSINLKIGRKGKGASAQVTITNEVTDVVGDTNDNLDIDSDQSLFPDA